MADPLTLAATIVTLVGALATVSQSCHNIYESYQHAHHHLISLDVECSALTTSLQAVRNIILAKSSNFQEMVRSDEDSTLYSDLSTTLNSCSIVINHLHEQISKLYDATDSKKWFSFTGRAKYVWNEDAIKTLLERTRGLTGAINLILNTLQTQSLLNVYQAVKHRQTVVQSVKASAKALELQDDAKSAFFLPNGAEAAGPTTEEANHLDELMKSPAYKKAFMKWLQEPTEGEDATIDSDEYLPSSPSLSDSMLSGVGSPETISDGAATATVSTAISSQPDTLADSLTQLHKGKGKVNTHPAQPVDVSGPGPSSSMPSQIPIRDASEASVSPVSSVSVVSPVSPMAVTGPTNNEFPISTEITSVQDQLGNQGSHVDQPLNNEVPPQPTVAPTSTPVIQSNETAQQTDPSRPAEHSSSNRIAAILNSVAASQETWNSNAAPSNTAQPEEAPPPAYNEAVSPNALPTVVSEPTVSSNLQHSQTAPAAPVTPVHIPPPTPVQEKLPEISEKLKLSNTTPDLSAKPAKKHWWKFGSKSSATTQEDLEKQAAAERESERQRQLQQVEKHAAKVQELQLRITAADAELRDLRGTGTWKRSPEINACISRIKGLEKDLSRLTGEDVHKKRKEERELARIQEPTVQNALQQFPSTVKNPQRAAQLQLLLNDADTDLRVLREAQAITYDRAAARKLRSAIVACVTQIRGYEYELTLLTGEDIHKQRKLARQAAGTAIQQQGDGDAIFPLHPDGSDQASIAPSDTSGSTYAKEVEAARKSRYTPHRAESTTSSSRRFDDMLKEAQKAAPAQALSALANAKMIVDTARASGRGALLANYEEARRAGTDAIMSRHDRLLAKRQARAQIRRETQNR